MTNCATLPKAGRLIVPRRLSNEGPLPPSILLSAREGRRYALLRRKFLILLALCFCHVVLLLGFTTTFGFLPTLLSWDPDIRQLRRNAQLTEFTGEASHIRMCRHLLPRLEQAMVIDTAEKKAESLGLRGLNLANIPELQIPDRIEAEYLMVEEDEHVCRTESTPTESLIQIFSSTLLSAAASKFQLNVEYVHNCPQWRKKDKDNEKKKEEKEDEIPLTIQEMLPADLLDNEQTKNIPLEVLAIKNICGGCIAEFEANNGTLSARNCALFTRPTVYTPLALYGRKKRRQGIKREKYSITRSISVFNGLSVGGKKDKENESDNSEENETQNSDDHRRTANKKKSQLPSGIVSILPVIKANLQKVGATWKDSLAAGKQFGDDQINRLKTRPGALVHPSKKVVVTPSIASMGEAGSYSKATDDDAVIYITCKKENCAQEEFMDALVMPYYIYSTEIPSSISSITVVVSQECSKYLNDCVSHGEVLTGFLTQLYPRAHVEFLLEQSTYAAFARMVASDYLLCPPGLGCMLPALSTEGRASQVSNTNLVFWLPQLSIENIWNIKFLPMAEVPVMSVKGLNFNTFLQKIPAGKIGVCRQLRARLGSWTKDMAMAPFMQYITPIRHYVGEADLRFEPTEALPFRTASTFKWEEGMFPTCGPQLLNIEGLCFAMAEIDMDRIFLIGDSSSMNQAQSLWKLLGNEDNPNVLGVRDPNWDRVIDCVEEGRTITISYARNDQLIENEKPVDIADDLRNCYAYCYPWVDRYLDFEGTTILIVNTGGHYQTHHQFQHALREFIKKVDSLERVWDVMLYRTSSPGHSDCAEKPDTPFSSYDEYANTITDEYSWEKFIGYNDYAMKFIDTRNREDARGIITASNGNQQVDILKKPNRIKMEVLDIYPMTALRRDGHVSGETCENCQSHTIRDCMHYFLPGPIDWWNHMLFSHILDLGRRE